MKYPVNINEMMPSMEYFSEVAALLKESRDYLESYKWCEKIVNGWLFVNLGEILCIFLYKIENNQSPDDDLIWIIVGDFPPVYLDSEDVRNTREVVEVYIVLVNDWIKHAEFGGDMEECFPLLDNWTTEQLEMLKTRTALLETSILPGIPEVSLNEIYST